MITEIEKDGQIFLVDREKTFKYYATHSTCDCDGCQNFYKQINGLFSELEKFLTVFGVDIAKPEELMWYDIDNYIEYCPYYTATGNFKASYKYEIDFGKLKAVFYQNDDPMAYIPNEQTEPYFVIEILNITLPWTLNSPFPSAPTLNDSSSSHIKKNFITRLFNKYKKE